MCDSPDSDEIVAAFIRRQTVADQCMDEPEIVDTRIFGVFEALHHFGRGDLSKESECGIGVAGRRFCLTEQAQCVVTRGIVGRQMTQQCVELLQGCLWIVQVTQEKIGGVNHAVRLGRRETLGFL